MVITSFTISCACFNVTNLHSLLNEKSVLYSCGLLLNPTKFGLYQKSPFKLRYSLLVQLLQYLFFDAYF